MGESLNIESSKSFKELNEMLGMSLVKGAVQSLAKMVIENIRSEEAGEEVLEISPVSHLLG